MDTILSVGARGECPEQLIALLQAAGYEVPTTDAGDELTPAVMEQVKIAASDMDVEGFGDQFPVTLPSGQEAVVKGQLVIPPFWEALRVAAATRTGLVTRGEAEALTQVGVAHGAAQVEAETAATQLPEGVTAGEQAAAAETAAREAPPAAPPAAGDTSDSGASTEAAKQEAPAAEQAAPATAAEQAPVPEGVTAGEQAAAAETAAREAAAKAQAPVE